MAKKKDKSRRRSDEKNEANSEYAKTQKENNGKKDSNSRSSFMLFAVLGLTILAILALAGIIVGVNSLVSDNEEDNQEDVIETDSQDESSDSDNENSSESTESDETLDESESSDTSDSSNDDSSISDSDDISTQDVNQVESEDNSVNSDAQGANGEVLGASIAAGTQWIANDIQQNQLSGINEYTVQSGDTLWEISEGTYGSGFQWTQILQANSGHIGFLADGSQALIIPGQVLTIP